MKDTSETNQKKLRETEERTTSIITKINKNRHALIHNHPHFTEEELNHIAFCLGVTWMAVGERLVGDLRK